MGEGLALPQTCESSFCISSCSARISHRHCIRARRPRAEDGGQSAVLPPLAGEGKSAQHVAATLQRVADRQGMSVATRVDDHIAAGKLHPWWAALGGCWGVMGGVRAVRLVVRLVAGACCQRLCRPPSKLGAGPPCLPCPPYQPCPPPPAPQR